MPEQFQSVSKSPPIFGAADGIKPLDAGGGAVGNVSQVNGIVGIAPFSFSFFNGGGTDNLLPGRPTTATAPFTFPNGATGAFICLTSMMGAFVTNGGANLTERALGEMQFDVGFGANNTVSCTVQLSDSNGDDPVKMSVTGLVVFLR